MTSMSINATSKKLKNHKINMWMTL